MCVYANRQAAARLFTLNMLIRPRAVQDDGGNDQGFSGTDFSVPDPTRRPKFKTCHYTYPYFSQFYNAGLE